jgi:hypothetical protein
VKPTAPRACVSRNRCSVVRNRLPATIAPHQIAYPRSSRLENQQHDGSGRVRTADAAADTRPRPERRLARAKQPNASKSLHPQSLTARLALANGGFQHGLRFRVPSGADMQTHQPRLSEGAGVPTPPPRHPPIPPPLLQRYNRPLRLRPHRCGASPPSPFANNVAKHSAAPRPRRGEIRYFAFEVRYSQQLRGQKINLKPALIAPTQSARAISSNQLLPLLHDDLRARVPFTPGAKRHRHACKCDGPGPAHRGPWSSFAHGEASGDR